MDTAQDAGFTLLELIVVIGIISLMAGIGIGYLGNVDPETVARAVMAGELRAAQMTARAEGVPTQVVVTPGADGEPATVQARLLQPVAAFHFEPGTPVLDERMRPTIRGEEVEAGRFGFARRPAADDRGALLEWRLGELYADLGEGFVLRVDLFLEARERGAVVEIDQLLELRLDGELRPEARLKVRDVDGATATVRAQGARSLPLRRWVTLEFGCDGRQAWLAADDRELARVAAPGTPEQGKDAALEVSPSPGGVPGLVDEVRLLAFGFAPAQTLPIELQPKRTYRFVYDERGEAVSAPNIEYVDHEEGAR